MVYAPSSVSYSCQPRNVAPRSVVGVVLRQACPLGQVELLSRISPSAPLTYPKCINNNLTHRTECIYAFSRNNAPSRAAGYTPLRWSKKTTCGDVKANTQHAIDLMHHRRPDSGASAKTLCLYVKAIGAAGRSSSSHDSSPAPRRPPCEGVQVCCHSPFRRRHFLDVKPARVSRSLFFASVCP